MKHRRVRIPGPTGTNERPTAMERRNVMGKQIKVPGEVALATGILLISFAVTLMVRADFGISTISSLPFVLSRIFDEISFGTWNLIFQICLLVILVAVTKRSKSGYIISFLFAAMFGFILDLFGNFLAGLPTDMALRLLYSVVSYLIMCVAISLMVGSKVPLMIVDSFINDLMNFSQVTFRRMKTLFDIVCVTLSVALSLALLGSLVGVGVGTVVMALITGIGVQTASRAIKRVIIIEPWSKRLGDMAK
jgi:uncharacterized membrane protein YczE